MTDPTRPGPRPAVGAAAEPAHTSGDDPVDVTTGKPAASKSTASEPARTRAHLRRFFLTYWGRLAFTAGFCYALIAATGLLVGQGPTVVNAINMSTAAAVLSCRYVRDLHIAYTAVLLFMVGVALPVAIITGSADFWVCVGWQLFCGALGAVIYRRAKRNERRRRSIWLTEPTGRQTPLDSRPYRCRRCDRVHHAVFALGQPVRLPEFPPNLHVVADTRRPRRHARVHVVARLTVDDEGQVWLGPAPEEFVPGNGTCVSFTVRPQP